MCVSSVNNGYIPLNIVKGSKSDKVEWEEANQRCISRNDSLVSIQDIQNHRSLMMVDSSIWSSVKGTFTPWIAYRGK